MPVRLESLLFFLAVSVLGCSESLGPNGEQLVQIQDNTFAPASKSITPGQTVMWQWGGGNQHNVTWVAQNGPPASPTQSAGTYARAFDAAGTYAYYCTIHGTPTSGMYGTVTVKGSSGGGSYAVR